MKYIDKNTENLIIKSYLNNQGVHNICKTFGIHCQLFYKIIDSNQIKRKGVRHKLPKKISDGICHLLKNNTKVKIISELYNVSYGTVQRWAKIIGIKLEPSQFKRIYTLNESFFRNIDTPEKAQVLGVFFADGWIGAKNHTIGIKLQTKDLEYMKTLNSVLGSNRPLYFIKPTLMTSPVSKKQYMDHGSYSLCFGSKIMRNQLISCGLLPNKSHKNFSFPDESIIPKHLQKYFILGFLEGDGWISLCSKNNRVNVGFCGGYNICNDIKNIIFSHLNITGTLHKVRSNFYSLSYNCIENNIKLLNWLYTNAPFKMDRKYHRYLEALKRFKSKGYNINPN